MSEVNGQVTTNIEMDSVQIKCLHCLIWQKHYFDDIEQIGS